MGVTGDMDYNRLTKEELIQKVRELEDEVSRLKMRESELEMLLSEYSSIMKKQFEVFDDFIKDVGTRRMIDPLTRVYSREHILKLISYYHQKAFEENFGYALVTITINNFNKLEQMEKEHALLSIGKLLKELVRVPLDSVGRSAEDQFIVLLTEITKENALKVKDRIENALALHNIDATVRFAAYPEDSTNLEELVKMVQ
ncbi:diguanylate cyclase (GGDEF) domain-containing protein [Fervidobacterium pennivorans DSM 9078]|jgi:diguanylate cyclase (GGDEF)-like protein|uniref:Diguanylate cyclase (GGDEF) domain-containing protein n=1 Tax=Fervidobacterium pennivorans (strain DSM 9078 / Ven5) TaxID=771875 RepID=H9U9P3_FERPD|nr:diguanylate cyclase [Fervidobacterium pennivorans]AFG34236.1 diguanylate cyclase (GGDEF) domain-containing protein [Fervidobacterium pennivorans DSM 9078]